MTIAGGLMVTLLAGAANAQDGSRSAPLPPPTETPRYVQPPAPAPPLSQARGPVPANNPGEWIQTDDYPIRALREEREGTTAFRLTVGVDGLVTACTITGSSGSPDLDSAACLNATRRARFKPAVGSDGRPAIGTYATRVNWVIPEDVEPGPQELAIPKHPMPGQSVITYTIGIDGRAVDCQLVSGPDPADFLLWAMPCDYNQVFPVYTNAAGKAVPRKVRLVLSVTLPTATAPAPKRKKRR
ncbi:MAG TPA: energy transducer TonB [Novosphingobium sp.]|nr:energy transducer TonB [Novosphingobium sp.]